MAVQEDEDMLLLAHRLAAEPISADKKADLLHKFERADDNMKVRVLARSCEQPDVPCHGNAKARYLIQVGAPPVA